MLTKHPFLPGRQRGAVLFFAIGVLVATTLAGIALTRSVDTSNIIAGNLAFQQSAVSAGDAGIERAVAWLQANKATIGGGDGKCGASPSLWCDDAKQGYAAKSKNPTTGESWDAFWTGTLVPAGQVFTVPTKMSGNKDAAGNIVSYAIERLCTRSGSINGDPDLLGFYGALNANPCARPPVDESEGQTHAGPGSSPPLKLSLQLYYRITVRIEGPRNTLSYVQALIAL